MRSHPAFTLLICATLLANPVALHSQDLLTARDVVALDSPVPEQVISYGEGPLQFGHLRLPKGEGPHPVVLFVHGGCWLSMFDIGHVGQLELALTREGYAVWSLEYRRVGDEGGGWPGTFRDVGAGADHLRVLAEDYPLDLNRVIAAGHSAGAHFAIWLAARDRILQGSELWADDPLTVRGVLALAPAADLEELHDAGVCGNVIDALMGGSPEGVPERYAAASPMQLVPIGVPQTLVVGAHDESWGPGGKVYLNRAREAGDESIVLVEAPESGHFEMIVPSTSSWSLVVSALEDLSRRVGFE